MFVFLVLIKSKIQTQASKKLSIKQ